MEIQQASQPRQIAYLVNIKDIKKSKFFKEEGWNPNFVLINGKNVSRVNIIAAIISSFSENNVQTINLDDGTGQIAVKNFNSPIDVKTGDIVLLVGRVRKYGNETYLTPEIVKKNVNVGWGAVWKKMAVESSDEEIEMNDDSEEESSVEEELIETNPGEISFREKIMQKIKDLDDGEGASYGDVVKLFPDEHYISKLLLDGDIFEIKPGRLKVLD